jgi:hypothetical protein
VDNLKKTKKAPPAGVIHNVKKKRQSEAPAGVIHNVKSQKRDL